MVPRQYKFFISIYSFLLSSISGIINHIPAGLIACNAQNAFCVAYQQLNFKLNTTRCLVLVVFLYVFKVWEVPNQESSIFNLFVYNHFPYYNTVCVYLLLKSKKNKIVNLTPSHISSTNQSLLTSISGIYNYL